ncbi:MAG: hypothetical protein HZA25_02265 [Candidatus Niyogibacteria bacterium]|nr:hypothetical protein [Candidatus Niyogibacteria bacterium]
MAKKALFLAMILLFSIRSATAEEIKLPDIGKDIEANMRRELQNYPWIEIDHMSENDPADMADGRLNIFGRDAANKFRTAPDPFQRSFYQSYAMYLNIAVDNTGLRDFLRRYERLTKVDVRFNVSESWQSFKASEPAARQNIYFETKAAVEVTESGDSRIGLKFDPRGLDLDRIQNFTAFAEHSSGLGRLEIRYASFSNLSILASKDDLFHIPTLNISGEYKALDHYAYLGASYRLSGDWRAKLSGSYGLENSDRTAILIFYRPL